MLFLEILRLALWKALVVFSKTALAGMGGRRGMGARPEAGEEEGAGLLARKCKEFGLDSVYHPISGSGQ